MGLPNSRRACQYKLGGGGYPTVKDTHRAHDSQWRSFPAAIRKTHAKVEALGSQSASSAKQPGNDYDSERSTALEAKVVSAVCKQWLWGRNRRTLAECAGVARKDLLAMPRGLPKCPAAFTSISVCLHPDLVGPACPPVLCVPFGVRFKAFGVVFTVVWLVLLPRTFLARVALYVWCLEENFVDHTLAQGVLQRPIRTFQKRIECSGNCSEVRSFENISETRMKRSAKNRTTRRSGRRETH